MSDQHISTLSTGLLPTQDPDHGLGHVIDPIVYLRTLLALLVLTAITVGASRVHFGSFNIVIAILIATVKAGLVASFFMHLKFETKLLVAFAIYPLIVLTLLIGGTMADEAARIEVRPPPQPVVDMHH